MTEKRENILFAALQLFAREGYHATSTSKVAKAAGVSEGLIFRHYQNKEGLVNAILEEGENRLKPLFVDIVMEPDPKEVIRKTITMTSKIDLSDYDFWKLQFKLKWELEISGDKKMEPVKMALINAFQKLGHESPEIEAKLLILFIEGIGSALLKGPATNQDDIVQLLLKKYNV